MRIKFYTFIILSFLSCSYPQINSADDFSRAVSLFSEEKYNQALVLFEKLIDAYPEKPNRTAAIVFKGKILLALNRNSDAKNTVINFLNDYPSSRYTEEARFLLAKIYIAEEQYLKAFNQLLSVIQNTSSEDYLIEAAKQGENIALNYLSVEELNDILNSRRDDKLKPYMLLLKGKLQMTGYSFDDAAESFEVITNKYPHSRFVSEAQSLLSRISGRSLIVPANKSLICAMVPLSNLSSNETVAASKEILEGIKFALDEFNNGRDDKLGLIIEDTENSPEKIREIKNRLKDNPAVKLLIGPVFSNEVRVTLQEFSTTDLPIISPTATDNKLTQINENFFQANPNFSVRAKGMAQYIYYVENKRKIAVLNSVEGYSPLLAAEFSEEFIKLGGEIIVKYTYNSADFSAGIKIDSVEMTEAEGLYVPIADKMDAPLILSQLVQNGINVPLYGNQDWFIAKGFETSPELSNKMIFESDYFIEYSNQSYQDFNESFLSKTRINANRNVLYGYDAAKYVITVLRNISPDRKIITAKIKSGLTVNGFHNNISFNENRTNLFINIVRYRDGFFELVDKFRVQNN